MMRPFVLQRDEDVSGVSGVGVVAEGVEFSDGTAAMRWLSEHKSTAIYASIADLKTIHEHDGKSRVTYVSLLPT